MTGRVGRIALAVGTSLAVTALAAVGVAALCGAHLPGQACLALVAVCYGISLVGCVLAACSIPDEPNSDGATEPAEPEEIRELRLWLDSLPETPEVSPGLPPRMRGEQP